jgi:zinc transporter ZupT
MGALLAVAVRTRAAAFAWLLAAQLPTNAGAAVALQFTGGMGAAWTHYLLAVAAGCLLFLGGHAVHNDWKRRGAKPAIMPAIAGASGAAVLQQFAEFFRLSL